MSKVCIIGAGAAGMYAAIAAAGNGHEVHVFEKNEKAGRKLFITGKGRCNITNACGDVEDLLNAVRTNAKFLYSSFYTHTNQDVINFFEGLGLKTKIERGERVFPVSDHSSDVIRALEKEMRRLGVKVHVNSEVADVLVEDLEIEAPINAGGGTKAVKGLRLKSGEEITCGACIVATGGCSYPSTGSTGDGYRFAKEAGHAVTERIPSLVPMETKEEWVKDLMGLSLRNVEFSVRDGKRELYREFGEMLFTHFGISGPVVLSASAAVGEKLQKKNLDLYVDLKPALSEDKLDTRLLRDFEEQKNKQFKNALGKLFPAKLIPVMVRLSGIDPEKKVNEISREERLKFVGLIKHLKMTAIGLRGWNEAIITKGGVSVREIDPGTMESKKARGLYFAGEVLDLDAVTGGFNLQIAWSTGYMAGQAIL